MGRNYLPFILSRYVKFKDDKRSVTLPLLCCFDLSDIKFSAYARWSPRCMGPWSLNPFISKTIFPWPQVRRVASLSFSRHNFGFQQHVEIIFVSFGSWWNILSCGVKISKSQIWSTFLIMLYRVTYEKTLNRLIRSYNALIPPWMTQGVTWLMVIQKMTKACPQWTLFWQL